MPSERESAASDQDSGCEPPLPGVPMASSALPPIVLQLGKCAVEPLKDPPPLAPGLREFADTRVLRSMDHKMPVAALTGRFCRSASQRHAVAGPEVLDVEASCSLDAAGQIGSAQQAEVVSDWQRTATAEIMLNEQTRDVDRKPRRPWYAWPFWLLARQWDMASLFILLAVMAAIPIVQLASLGYILRAAGILAAGGSWRNALPGIRLAGKVGTFALLATLLWLPVWFVTDLAYSAQLLEPGSLKARSWRWFAFGVTFVWMFHVAWAAMRGGKWWQLLWPAPIRFITRIWRPRTWCEARDQLWSLVGRLKFPSLWWLGARGAAGALLWTCVPVSLMIIGERAQDFKPAALVGFIGAISMTLVMLYLPMLQILLAVRNRFTALFDIREIRRLVARAPWACAASLVLLCLLAIPLYILRIEAPPRELLWLPSIVFVVMMLPAKLLIGAAMGLGARQPLKRHWSIRWSAKLVAVAGVLVYVGALYVSQFIAWQGAYVMYFQHAVLVPAPLLGN